ncbi:MAG: hypothetical protein JKY94_01135 [Rhodobacteraceae bacterium]|nr:hypothetical protein [Paracoccaceae bacterium]
MTGVPKSILDELKTTVGRDEELKYRAEASTDYVRDVVLRYATEGKASPHFLAAAATSHSLLANLYEMAGQTNGNLADGADLRPLQVKNTEDAILGYAAGVAMFLHEMRFRDFNITSDEITSLFMSFNGACDDGLKILEKHFITKQVEIGKGITALNVGVADEKDIPEGDQSTVRAMLALLEAIKKDGPTAVLFLAAINASKAGFKSQTKH